ncbi:VanZ family protein [Paenibacillus mendelii]|uniref:VanZ family protein n=1 Tax=Paenibacillus mendelii TaxID=206163 RepID=A0ABV6JAW5_9BACL|nr:VanZ family protein [Paenibacillus mendelii]MCQ6562922.1 VanZ family protein [Paenibacillus mendelii]
MFAAILLLLYTGLLLYWMFIGFGRSDTAGSGYRYNYIPFQTIQLYFNHADHFRFKMWVINIVGNVAVFVPFGLAIPYLLQYGFFRFMFRFIAVLFVLETMQMLLKRGSFDIDDIILNSAGALIGFMLYRIIRSIQI